MKITTLGLGGFCVLLFQIQYLLAQQSPVGLFDHHQDVGDPKLKGNVVYNPEKQAYLFSGAGKNVWANQDQFHFAWKKMKGDFIIRATVKFIGKGVEGHRKIGIMVRDQLTTDSRYIDATVHGGVPVNTSIQFRPADGGQTSELLVAVNHPTEIELERSGNTFSFSAAVFGENYKTITKEMDVSEEPYVGLYICSHTENVVEQAEFSNVQIIIPPAKNDVPYRDYIGSHIEVMDITTGHRKILYSAPNSLQAPNWTPDGNYLIYNSEGLLYKYSLVNGSIARLNTGGLIKNNNDHVLSMDGTMLGISDQSNKVSMISILPSSGSDKPVLISDDQTSQSYLHGWSPDNKTLIFTGQRNNEWNIYAVDVASKKETPLTEDATLDDGSEFTPDGKYIYFNSVRTGTMKLWRMKPDGSEEEQVTFDEYNDWFPHISPDGQWIVFVSFSKDIDPADHPFYKKIYIRLMPAAGGVPRNIGYVFGGQGTMNVPSWSPDSKKIAFVSNSKF
jgi:Tol biopolymer transport system component